MVADAPVTQVVVCDMDDTLYLERDYVKSAFKAVGEWARSELSLAGFGEAAQSLFDSGQRERVFNAVLEQFGIEPTRERVMQCVDAYREHTPDIALQPDADAFISGLPNNWRLALVSDGFRVAQENKVAALGLAARGFDPVIVTDVWGRDYWKPHPRAFETIAAHYADHDCRLAYVADNSTKDFLAPNRLGWATVLIERPERSHFTTPPTPEHKADLAIASFAELAGALKKVAR